MTNVNSRRIRRTPGSLSNQKGSLADRKTGSAEGAAYLHLFCCSAEDARLILAANRLLVNGIAGRQFPSVFLVGRSAVNGVTDVSWCRAWVAGIDHCRLDFFRPITCFRIQ